MKYLKLFFLTVLLITVSSCSKQETTKPTTSEGTRIGCVCNDGTNSDATGSGACSGHGGVNYWLYGTVTTFVPPVLQPVTTTPTTHYVSYRCGSQGNPIYLVYINHVKTVLAMDTKVLLNKGDIIEVTDSCSSLPFPNTTIKLFDNGSKIFEKTCTCQFTASYIIK